MDENRTKQIEELKLVIDLYTNNVTNFNTYDLASYLVDQKFIPLRHAILQEEKIREEARKETAIEFAERLEQICRDRWEWFYDEKIDMEIHRVGRVDINDIEKLLKEYAKREWEHWKI